MHPEACYTEGVEETQAMTEDAWWLQWQNGQILKKHLFVWGKAVDSVLGRARLKAMVVQQGGNV